MNDKGKRPPRDGRVDLRRRINKCTSCGLYKTATQGVPGEGPRTARILLVGEQPGHEEDLSGHPFVGPAGELLDRALSAAGIHREDVYVTNAVKHFKWIARGKRRLHQKPNIIEINACRQWLEAEVSAIQPGIIVCLGATAAYAIMQRRVIIKKEGGRILRVPDMPDVLITVHPSAVLRASDKSGRDQLFKQLVRDLALVLQASRRNK